MSDTTISSAAFADTKPHYELLDGLRGQLLSTSSAGTGAVPVNQFIVPQSSSHSNASAPGQPAPGCRAVAYIFSSCFLPLPHAKIDTALIQAI